MAKKILILLLSLISLYRVSSAEETTDTLFSAKQAKSINVLSDASCIIIGIKDFDSTSNNYYYETSAQKSMEIPVVNSSTYKEVTDITVTEIDGKSVELVFTPASGGLSNRLVFEIPDPANRSVKSYIGTNISNFGFLSLGKSSKGRWDMISAGLGFGFVTPVNAPAEMATSMGKSFELNWLMILGVGWFKGHHSVKSGIGIDWRNFTMDGDRFYHKDYDGKIGFGEFDDSQSKHSSRLMVFSLQVPVLYSLNFGRRNCCAVTLGPIVNFNTHASLTTKYRFEERDYTISTGKLHQNPVTVDLFGGISYHNIGLYARYSPMNILKKSAGLNFGAFSTGLMIMF